ncbi:MAG: hypothetical protein WCE90_10000 [Candidatus Zixiibacteriota bacterium]
MALYISLAVIVLAFALGLSDSILKSWTCDDAFISFRYAKNLVDGKGLVYNVGERVEGYTNFLWTMLVAGGMKIGADPIKLTRLLGILCFALTILTYVWVSWRLFQRHHPFAPFIPLTALCLLLHRDFRVFATGGLETSLFTLLVTVGFAGLIFSKNRWGFLFTGLILVLAMMTRPDGIIFYSASLLFLVLTASSTPKRTLYFLIPLIVVYVPYYLWRLSYYHYPFPNTYYARSAYLSWWSQGLKYGILYFKAYYVFALLPALGVISTVRSKGSFGKMTKPQFRFSSVQNSVFLSTLFSLVYCLYVLRVGGDFMFARFFIPITPFLFFLIEAFALRMLPRKYLIPFAAMICLTTYFCWYPDQLRSLSNKVVDERYFYPKSKIEEERRRGEVLKKYLKDTQARVVIFGAQAMLAYYAEFPTAIEGEGGLTDEYLAHLRITKRTRPGHERIAPLDYLLRRGVNFAFGLSDSPPSGSLTDIYFGKVTGTIVVYDRNLMRELKKYNEVSFVDFEEFLDDYMSKMSSLPRSKVLEDYRSFKQYYFDHNSDPTRQNAFFSVLGKE